MATKQKITRKTTHLVQVNSAVVRRRREAKAEAAEAGPQKYRSASEFVREQPIDMPSKEVVTKAAKLGVTVTAGLVRVTRFKMRHRGEVKPVAGKAVRRGRPPAASRAASAPASGPVEVRFRRLVVQLGTARAMALVVEVETRIEALISA